MIHYLLHGAVGFAVYAAGRSIDKLHRQAWLLVAAAGFVRLHVEHHR